MNSNFKVLIVDDEVLIAEFLKDELALLGCEKIALAHNKEQAFKQIESFNPDAVLLDIRMKSEREGIEIAEAINIKYQIPFIFITAHSDKDLVKLALNTKPAGYITKPFKPMDVFAALKLLEVKKEEGNTESFILKDGYTNVKIVFNDILFVQSNDNYIHIHTTTKKYTVRNTLEWFKGLIPATKFHQTHRSYIVNISKITKYTSKFVVVNDIEIPVSRSNKFDI